MHILIFGGFGDIDWMSWNISRKEENSVRFLFYYLKHEVLKIKHNLFLL